MKVKIKNTVTFKISSGTKLVLNHLKCINLLYCLYVSFLFDKGPYITDEYRYFENSLRASNVEKMN